VVDRDDVDAACSQRLEHRLKLALGHREVAVDDGVLVTACKARCASPVCWVMISPHFACFWRPKKA
jgi:hypothetical protein